MNQKLLNTYKPFAVLLTFIMLLSILSGCTGGNSGSKSEDKVLRIGVMYGGQDESYFRQQYTDIYEFSKGVKIEIVPAVNQDEYRYVDYSKPYEQPDLMEGVKKLLTGDNPVDVFFGDTGTLSTLIQENMVSQLDPLIQEDKFDISDFVPTVIEGIKDLGEGKLYALAPTFYSSALYYNKNIFTEANIEPPHDNMTWDEIFDLARLVSKGEGKDRVFGFSFNRYKGSDPYWDMTNYINPLQLRTFDKKGETMTVNGPQWEKAWNTISKLHMDKILPGNLNDEVEDGRNDGYYNPIAYDLFLSGRLAMTISENNFVNEIADANRNADKIEGYKPIEWDVVTVPSHPEKPGVSSNVSLQNTVSINSKAPNPDTAWDYLKFINSEDWAKIKSRSLYEMVSRKSFIQAREGENYNIAAFYNVKPLVSTDYEDTKLFQEKQGLYSVSDVGRTYFQMVIDNKKTTAEALKEWEEKGNKMLQEIKNNPKIMFDGEGNPYVPEDDKNGGGVEIEPRSESTEESTSSDSGDAEG